MNIKNIRRCNYSKEFYAKTGVYCITNIINNKKYVGISDVKIDNRYLSHNSNLKRNKHVNKKLQNSYNKYGVENFTFEVLELISNSTDTFLKKQEIYYIEKFDSFKNGFNMNEGGDLNYLYTPVYCYKIIKSQNVSFQFYKKYKGGNKAAKDLDYSDSYIWKVIKGKANSDKLKDYIFLDENEKKKCRNNLNKYLLEKYNKIQNLPIKGYAIKNYKPTKDDREKQSNTRSKTIYHFDLKGNFIKIWGSIKEAAEFLKVNPSNISNVLNGKQNYSANSIFKFETDKLKEKYEGSLEQTNLSMFVKKDKRKAIKMYDLKWVFVKEFDSIQECGKYLNVSTSNISACLSKKLKIAKKHRFKFSSDAL